MTINDRFHPEGLACWTAGAEYQRSGRRTQSDFKLAKEHTVKVYVNDVLVMRLVCSPELLPELVLGRLYTEGLIRGTEEVDYLYICSQGTRAKVTLTHPMEKAQCAVEKTPTCCTGNQVYVGLRAEELRPVTPIPWTEEWIYAMAERFEEGMPTYAATRGTHSCFLACEDRMLYCCEDLGRHNALDKLVGCALRDGVDLTRTMVYSSGRIPTDMTEKVIRAGIPILVSKTVPTDQAVQLAQQCRLTLICHAQSKGMILFNDGREAPAVSVIA